MIDIYLISGHQAQINDIDRVLGQATPHKMDAYKLWSFSEALKIAFQSIFLKLG